MCCRLLHASLRKVLLAGVLAHERDKASIVLVRVHVLCTSSALHILSQGGVANIELNHAVDVRHIDRGASGTREQGTPRGALAKIVTQCAAVC